MLYKKRCATCGKRFIAHAINSRVCSEPCRRTYYAAQKLECAAKWRAENRDWKHQYNRRWKKKNPDKVAASNAKYQRRVKRALALLRATESAP